MDNTTVSEIKAWLHTERGNLRAICEQSGVGYWWMQKFMHSHIKRPGFDKIVALHSVMPTDKRAA